MKALRIWFGCVVGFAMCTVFGWSNGMFGTLFPLFILSNLNRWNAQMFIQLLISIFLGRDSSVIDRWFFTAIPIIDDGCRWYYAAF